MHVEKVERLDHHGIVAGVIHDLGLVQLINDRIGVDEREKISVGESITAMIINGLGFTDRPLSLTPQFFANCPLELLFSRHLCAEDFNRYKLGRALDSVFKYGCDRLFTELSHSVCKQENIDTRVGHVDTTTFSLTGEYLPDSDENTISVRNGYSKDHRPDLKQVVVELLVSNDGGIPLMSKVFDGNTSDNEIFKQRSKELIAQFSEGPNISVLIGDSKLYFEKNCELLKNIAFITRIPETNLLAQETIARACNEPQSWEAVSSDKWFKSFDIFHHGIAQRWIVVRSSTSCERAKKSVCNQIEREEKQIKKSLYHLEAQRFDCREDAERTALKEMKFLKYHVIESYTVSESSNFSSKGRPKLNSEPSSKTYSVKVTVTIDKKVVKEKIEHSSCFIIGTNASKEEFTNENVLSLYSNQDKVERGFRFLKDPVFFASSLFLKKPSRIQGLLMVMVLSLIVYSIAERRLRAALLETEQTIPNQIDIPTSTPTLRWVFQLLDGVNRVSIITNGVKEYVWTGLTDLRKKILRLFGKKVSSLYQLT